LRKVQIIYNKFLTSISAASRQLPSILEAFVAEELTEYTSSMKKIIKKPYPLKYLFGILLVYGSER